MSNSEPEVDWAVFIPAVIIVLVCAIPLMIFPESASQILADGRKIIMTNFLWLYLIVGISTTLFCLWLYCILVGRKKPFGKSLFGIG